MSSYRILIKYPSYNSFYKENNIVWETSDSSVVADKFLELMDLYPIDNMSIIDNLNEQIQINIDGEDGQSIEFPVEFHTFAIRGSSPDGYECFLVGGNEYEGVNSGVGVILNPSPRYTAHLSIDRWSLSITVPPQGYYKGSFPIETLRSPNNAGELTLTSWVE